jgi:hypothetical protein
MSAEVGVAGLARWAPDLRDRDSGKPILSCAMKAPQTTVGGFTPWNAAVPDKATIEEICRS